MIYYLNSSEILSLAVEIKKNAAVFYSLGFCPVGKQKSKLLIILKGCQGDRKSSCAYVSTVAEETFKTTLGIGISKDLSVRMSSGPASLR